MPALARNGTPCEFDPDMWYSDDVAEQAEAIRLCATCPIRQACYEKGKTEEYGIWGGTLAPYGGDRIQSRLSQQDLRIESLMAEGLSYGKIAELLDVSRRTVERRGAIIRKTNAA